MQVGSYVFGAVRGGVRAWPFYRKLNIVRIKYHLDFIIPNLYNFVV
jgi:hypothetical protein